MLFNLNKVKEWASCVVAVLLLWPTQILASHAPLSGKAEEDFF